MTETTTAKRERKFKTAKRRVVNIRAVNPYDSDWCMAFASNAAYEAAEEMFPWLSQSEIRNPPRQLLDAKFARQVAVHLMASTLDMPQRQIARMQARQRTSIRFALRAVDKRLTDPVFAAAYRQALERTREIFERQHVQMSRRIGGDMVVTLMDRLVPL
jgi:hypothetical protein